MKTSEQNDWLEHLLQAHSIAWQLPAEEKKILPYPLKIAKEKWSPVAAMAKNASLRLAAEWGAQESDDLFSLFMVLVHPEYGYGLLQTTITASEPHFPSLTQWFPGAGRMERVIQDLFGLTPTHHPDPRPWIRHEHWPAHIFPLRKSFAGRQSMQRMPGEYPFLTAEGESAYEIPVGPVHAGIIEPGHFRFLAVGERILNLEERLGYLHRGIEKSMENCTAPEGVVLAGRVSGDSTVAHAWAFARACEQAAAMVIPDRAAMLRGILCERERMANHIGDIGAICNDAAWSFMHAQCQRLREEMADLHGQLLGHRLMMDLICPGGLVRDIPNKAVMALADQSAKIAASLAELQNVYLDHAGIQRRVNDCGVVTPKQAQELGLLGFIGRASGQQIDVRRDTPFPPYDQVTVVVPTINYGDVRARVWIRFAEVIESAHLIHTWSTRLTHGAVAHRWSEPEPGTTGFATIESWRGEILTWVRFGLEGRLDRFYTRDPSMMNWLGLELAVRNVPVPDFPLNNKSFNCSYAGHDL